jgi:hypothetical protein
MPWALLPIDFARISIGVSLLGLGPMYRARRRKCCGDPECGVVCVCALVCRCMHACVCMYVYICICMRCRRDAGLPDCT